MSKILVITADVIGDRMAGPAIRALEFARALARNHNVTLACQSVSSQFKPQGFEIARYRNEPSPRLVNQFDTVIVPGSLNLSEQFDIPMIVDVYDPFILSNLSRYNLLDPKSEALFNMEFSMLLHKLLVGDLFICASEKQKDFWLGMLAAVRRVNLHQYSEDKHLRNLIDIVPFGIPETIPQPAAPNPLPGHIDADWWLIWGGGIWNWFDPLTLLRALDTVIRKHPHIRLFFMGKRHPNPKMPEMQMARDTVALARDLRLLDRHVFFGDWIPYEQRGGYLAAANAAVSTHESHIETRFSFRTRILDYIWARRPIICTAGDAMGDLVQANKLGFAVPDGDAAALAAAIEQLATDRAYYQECINNLNRIAPSLFWSEVVAPLERFCADPRASADRVATHAFMEQIHGGRLISACQTRETPVGEIHGEIITSQEITIANDQFFRIDLNVATYDRINTGTAFFQIDDLESGKTVERVPVNMEHIEDNSWVSFRFKPQSVKSERKYRISLSAPDAEPGNTITLWADPGVDTTHLHGEEVRGGSLVYRAYALSDAVKRQKDNFFFRILRKLMGR